MKKKIILLLLSVIAILVLFACSKDAPSTQPEIGIPDGVVHKENIIPALDWNRSSSVYTDDDGTTTTMWWKLTETLEMGCNFINIFPNLNVDGKSISGAQMVGNHYEEILAECQPGLELSHEKGVKVITSLPMCLMFIDQYDAAGEDWKKLSQVTSYGVNRVDTSDSNVAYACVNNPLFQKKVRKYSIMAAKAGYDGVFYDAGPYSYGVRFNCNCKYCKKDWAAYTKAYYGKSVAMPEGDPDLSTEVGRLLWKWRHDIFIDFVFSVLNDCRTYNSEFTVWPNIGMNAVHSCYYTLKGLRTSMCEYSSNDITNPGVDSTLYFFRQYEAENPYDPLIMEFCDIGEQANPWYKYHTAYVEALAGGDSVMISTSTVRVETFGDFVAKCSEIKENNIEAFCDSKSIAETAILYSWQDMNAYHLPVGESPSFDENPSRMAASLLAAEGIPFDYILPERVKTLAHLQKYKTLIFVSLNILDKDFEALVEEYIRQGGQVIILGSDFAKQYTVDYGIKYADWESDVLESWTGTSFADADANRVGESFTVGNGKVYVVKKFIRLRKVQDATLNIFKKAGLYNLVKITEDIAGNVETTLRSNESGNKWWLNCITYASQGVYDEKPITIDVEIPAGETVTSVTCVSPVSTEEQIGLTWKQEGSKLTITATIGLWTMFTINK